jgi:hypothetical protein
MQQQVKRALSIGSTLILSLATLISIPFKSHVNVVEHTFECIDIGSFKWTPYMSKRYARAYILMHYPEWNRNEWKALKKLWTAESNWRHEAKNPKSTAYGIAQVLDTPDRIASPATSCAGAWRISSIGYERPSAAWAFHRSSYYY